MLLLKDPLLFFFLYIERRESCSSAARSFLKLWVSITLGDARRSGVVCGCVEWVNVLDVELVVKREAECINWVFFFFYGGLGLGGPGLSWYVLRWYVL